MAHYATHVPKDERKKLDSKSRRHYFLGYGSDTKGYCLYDPRHERVFSSHDVLFSESTVGIEKEPSDQEKKQSVEVDDNIDDETCNSVDKTGNESVQEDPETRL